VELGFLFRGQEFGGVGFYVQRLGVWWSRGFCSDIRSFAKLVNSVHWPGVWLS